MALVNCPKVDESTTVSRPEKLTVFNRLVAWARNSNRLPSLDRGISFVTVISTFVNPGPVIVFRPAFPKNPGAGRAKASVLKKWSTDLSDEGNETGKPVESARSEVLVVIPWVKVELPEILAVSGVPD